MLCSLPAERVSARSDQPRRCTLHREPGSDREVSSTTEERKVKESGPAGALYRLLSEYLLSAGLVLSPLQEPFMSPSIT